MPLTHEVKDGDRVRINRPMNMFHGDEGVILGPGWLPGSVRLALKHEGKILPAWIDADCGHLDHAEER